MSHVLRVVAWDDPRCVQPLEAAAEAWLERTGERIEIVRRPLTAFNDQPLIELSPICDVMIIDYPHIAKALDERAITPIESLVGAEALRHHAKRAVGPAQDSFVVGGVTAALASDAACLVSAFRRGTFEAWSEPVPETWDDVFALQEMRPGSVALALHSTDAISCLMSLAAGAGAGPDGGDRLFPDPGAALRSLDLLKRLTERVSDLCWASTPQALFIAALSNAEIAYIPFTFGYSQKTKPEQGGWSFGAPPRGSGSLLGGAGMAVSSQSAAKDRAALFVEWYCGDDGQRLAGRHGGQPAGLAAWDDPVADRMADGFFSDTRPIQERAYVRPLAPWWPAVQMEAGETLVKTLRAGRASAEILAALETAYGRHRAKRSETQIELVS